MQIGRWKCLSHNFDTNERWKAKKLPTIYGWLFFEWQMVCVVGTFGAGNEYINRLLTLIFFFYLHLLCCGYDRHMTDRTIQWFASFALTCSYQMDFYESNTSIVGWFGWICTAVVTHIIINFAFAIFQCRSTFTVLHIDCICANECLGRSARARVEVWTQSTNAFRSTESLNTWVSNVSMEM